MALPKQTLLPPPKNQPSEGFVDSAESKKEISGQENSKKEEKASLLNPSSPPSPPENQGVSFFKKNKTIAIALSLILALVAIGGGVYLVQQRAAIKPKAAPEDVPLCAGMSTIRCWGECQPDTCREYEVCELAGGGFCQNRKINDKPTYYVYVKGYPPGIIISKNKNSYNVQFSQLNDKIVSISKNKCLIYDSLQSLKDNHNLFQEIFCKYHFYYMK